MPDSETEVCGAPTSKNGRCGNKPVPTLGVCHVHLEHSAVTVEKRREEQPVWERQADEQLRGGA